MRKLLLPVLVSVGLILAALPVGLGATAYAAGTKVMAANANKVRPVLSSTGMAIGSSEAAAAAVRAYWTPARMAQAFDNSRGSVVLPASGSVSTAPLVKAPSPFVSAATTATPATNFPFVDQTARNRTGVIFMSNSSNQSLVCSGVSVTEGQNNPIGVVETAAHCLEDSANAFNPFTNIMFAPGYNRFANPPTPFGQFPGFQYLVSAAWIGNPKVADQGFFTVAVNASSQSLQGAVGASPMVKSTLPGTFGTTGGNPDAITLGYTSPTLDSPLCSGTFSQDAGGSLWTADVCPAQAGMSGGPLWQTNPCSGTCTAYVAGNIVGHNCPTTDPNCTSGAAYGTTNNINSTALYNGLIFGGGHQIPAGPGQIRLVEPPPPLPAQPAHRTAYYPSWSIYANAFYPKNLDTQGIAGNLTTLNYAFENIDPVNLTCLAANKAASTDPNTTTGNDGSSDAWADYQVPYTTANSVNGTADAFNQPLKGNFNQLKQLKAKYPNLNVQVSLGGWTYSKYFSDVAATDASRKKFVSSCIDMYIKGNLPVLAGSPAGGPGAAAGVFDGFNVDWEFPASANGHPGNHFGPQDTANYTALLNEFRTELDALGGKHYTLTAALPSGPSDINNLQLPNVASALDMGEVMTYDMHGAFETTGPTNFQAPLYDSSFSPAYGSGLSVDTAITHYIAGGFPAAKLSLGVPFYGRGWTGVPNNGLNGQYQSVTGPTAAFPFSQQPGVVDFKELATAGKLTPATTFYDYETQSSWVYDGTNFWTIETPQSLTAKRQYIQNKGLGGIMMYSLEADSSTNTLFNAAAG